MKKIIIALIIIISVTLVLTACGESNFEEEIIGLWECVEYNGPDYGVIGFTENGFVEFTNDGRLIISNRSNQKNMIEIGTYKIDGKRITLSNTGIGSTSSDININGDSLHIDDSKFVRVNKNTSGLTYIDKSVIGVTFIVGNNSDTINFDIGYFEDMKVAKNYFEEKNISPYYIYSKTTTPSAKQWFDKLDLPTVGRDGLKQLRIAIDNSGNSEHIDEFLNFIDVNGLTSRYSRDSEGERFS